MKVALIIFIFLLPYLTLAAYDESSRRKVKLEDIENEHIQNERHSKVIHSLPPPFSKQPAKGQAMKIYSIPTTSEDSVPEYQKPNPSSSNRYALTTQHHVQPLVDQVTASEADYQPSPAYQRETIVYFPSHAHGQSVLQGNSLQQQQQQQQAPQQPTPLFYYSHDVQQSQHQQQQLSPNDYQLQFVPIGQNGRHDEQHIDSSKAVITYSHDVGNTQLAIQPVQYVSNAENQEPNEDQSIYNLPANVLFQSPKDIEYAKPTNTYGPPPSLDQSYSNPQKVIEYSQDVPIQKTPTHQYTSQNDNVRPSSTYGGLESQESLFNQQKDIEFAQQVHTESANKPAIVYGPPHAVGEEPQIQYGVPDASFRQPVFQSNQDTYAPRRPDSSTRSNSKPFSVSFPYPPSFISITTERPIFEKATPSSEPSYVEGPQWQANVMPLHLTPPQETQYRSYGNAEAVQNPRPTASPDVNINQHIEVQSAPLIDFFHSRQAKSLLESYIPSWLVAQMQEQHSRNLNQQNQQQQHQHQQHQNFALPSQTAEHNYNTIAYSTDFENIYGTKLKRSISKSKLSHQKRKPGRK